MEKKPLLYVSNHKMKVGIKKKKSRGKTPKIRELSFLHHFPFFSVIKNVSQKIYEVVMISKNLIGSTCRHGKLSAAFFHKLLTSLSPLSLHECLGKSSSIGRVFVLWPCKNWPLPSEALLNIDIKIRSINFRMSRVLRKHVRKRKRRWPKPCSWKAIRRGQPFLKWR